MGELNVPTGLLFAVAAPSIVIFSTFASAFSVDITSTFSVAKIEEMFYETLSVLVPSASSYSQTLNAFQTPDICRCVIRTITDTDFYYVGL